MSEHEAPLVGRLRPAQEEAVVIEQPDRPGEAGRHLGQLAQQGGAQVVEDQDAALLAVPVEDRGGEADHRLERPFDLVVLDVQVERRGEDVAAAEVEGLGEVVAVGLRLQLALRDGGRLAVVVIDPDPLAALVVEVADLVVDAAPLAEQDVFVLDLLAAAGRVGEEIAQDGLVGQVEQVGLDDLHLAADDVGVQGSLVGAGLLVQGVLVAAVQGVQGEDDNPGEQGRGQEDGRHPAEHGRREEAGGNSREFDHACHHVTDAVRAALASPDDAALPRSIARPHRRA